MEGREPEIRVVRGEDGAAAVEYGLLLACVFLAVFLAVQALGLSLMTIFTTIVDLFNS